MSEIQDFFYSRDGRRAKLTSLQHQLRTPVSAIAGYTRMLEQEAPVEYRGRLDRIRTAAEELEGLVGNLSFVEHKEGVHIDRDFDEFLAMLRRELATPMHVILGFCEILSRDMRDDGSALDTDVDRIVEATQRLLSVLDQSDEDPDGTGIDTIVELSPPLDSSLTTSADIEPYASTAWEIPKDCTVLVVEDDEMNRILLVRHLEDQFSVRTANDGREALNLLQTVAVDLVLLDMVMPELDGFGVLQAMRDDEVLRHVPVIVISAVDDLESVVRCFELGAQEYLPKTFNRTLFDARVRAVLERKRLHDQARRYMSELRVERERSDRLLTKILPAPVAERLKLGEATIADSFDCVTVVFLDLVGFTEWSARMVPHELVSRLNALFLKFDDIAEQHGVEKLKTMGDSYMMAAGLPRPSSDHAVAAARASFDMIDALGQHNIEYEHKLNLRCGIHSGSVVAGVIGRSRFAYDIWGDTVNVASRMESHGVPGRIHVSADAAELLRDDFSLTSRGNIPVRGKGDMETFLLDRLES